MTQNTTWVRGHTPGQVINKQREEDIFVGNRMVRGERSKERKSAGQPEVGIMRISDYAFT